LIPADADAALEAAMALLGARPSIVELLSEFATARSAEDELCRSVRALSGAKWELQRYRPEEVGRITVSFPSNNLLYSYVLYGIIPALYCQDIIIRPSSRSRSIVEALHAELGRLLPGPLAGRITLAKISQRAFSEASKSADLVVFTGRYDNGLDVVRRVGAEPRVLLMGSGPNPVIAGPGCDPAEVCRSLLAARLYNSGQDCLGPDVMFVHSAQMGSVLAELCKAVARIEVADRADPATLVAPLVYRDAVANAAAFLNDHAPRVVVGGHVDQEAAVVEPSVLVFREHAEFHPPELFAPIVPVVPYSDPGFLLHWAEQPAEVARGMYCSLYGEPALTAARLGTAVICREASPLDIEDGNQPFGGFGMQASSVHHRGAVAAQPLLLSEQAAQLNLHP
jgi:acyl-CoA reductase-like NAD-dependent aldehyde dehydrogenase